MNPFCWLKTTVPGFSISEYKALQRRLVKNLINL